MAIGATIGARLRHLQDRKGMKDTELAKMLHIDRDTLKRIINGGTEKVSSQVIIDAAQHFGVSTDFLLGLTDVPDAMNYPVEEFGLTAPAARAILSEDIHTEMLNLLPENQRFCQLTHTMSHALEPDQTEGIMSRNNLLAKQGDEKACLQLLEQNRPYIVEQMTKIGFRYHPYWKEMIEWGEIRIISSIQDYDPSRGTKFFTFVAHKIQTELRDFLHSIRPAYMENYYPDDENGEDA